MSKSYPTIFLVEDDPTQARIFEHMLNAGEFHCVVARDGSEAIQKAKELAQEHDTPDLLLLDFHLPGQTGLELLQELYQEVPFWTDIPYVLLTAEASTSVMVQAFTTGAHDYLTKPVKKELLLAKLRAILRRTSAEQNATFSIYSVKPGFVIDERYAVLSRLGSGGMARVFKVKDRPQDRVVALKMLNQSTSSSDPTAEQRFHREVEAQRELQHPHLISVYDIGEFKGLFYYTMEYLPGGSLLHRIQGGPLAVKEAVVIVAKLASLLDYVHQHEILHRDIKSENILFSADDEPVLTDFGLALRLNSSETRLTQQDHVVGTPCYMSPERITNEDDIDHRSDIFALGMLLYEILTGYLPHSNQDLLSIYNLLREGLPSPSERNKAIPEQVARICMKAIRFDPKDRYQTATAMAYALNDTLKRLK